MMETYGTYNGIKFLMDGSMELSFLVPHHEKSHLLASIDEITQAGMPTLEITAKKKRTASSASARRRFTASISALWGNMSRWHCVPMRWSGSAKHGRETAQAG